MSTGSIHSALMNVDPTMLTAAMMSEFSFARRPLPLIAVRELSQSRRVLESLVFVPLKLAEEQVISGSTTEMRQGIVGVAAGLTNPLLESPSLDTALARINKRRLFFLADKAARDMLLRPLREDRLLYELSDENPVLFRTGEQAEMFVFEEGMEDPEKRLFLAGVATICTALNQYDRVR